jgi:enterochelin esterase-like enzyme
MKRPLVNTRVTLSGITMPSFATTMMLAMTLVVLEFPSNNMPMVVDAMSTTNKKPLLSMTLPLTSSPLIPSVQKITQKVTQKITPPPRKTLTPPFPNGLCGGTVLDIAPEETFGVDVNLANINVLGDMVLLPRTIQIWLPPGYDDEDEVGHSVLYVHDGQNSMEDKDSWTGASWRLVGALTRLADHELICSRKKTVPADLGENQPQAAVASPEEKLPIVVMLPSAEGDWLPGVRRRHLEYGDMNLPFAQAHADFVANTVKPLVDNRFRTDPSPQQTFCMGSSLGGQASLHLLLRHPDKFGGAACLSPAFGPAILDCVDSPRGREILKGGKKKLYFDIGGDMDDSKSDFVRVSPIDVLDHLTPVHGWNPGYFWLDTQLQGQVAAMKKALDRAGIEYEYRQYPGGRHNERAWALRIDKPLLHLFSNDNNKQR